MLVYQENPVGVELLSHVKVLFFPRYFHRCWLREWKCELNNNTAHRTHNNTVSWFIPLQSDSQTLTKLDEKTSKENSRSPCFYDSSSSSLLSTHVLITLFGSPSPNLVVLFNVTKPWGVGWVNLSYKCSINSVLIREKPRILRKNKANRAALGLFSRSCSTSSAYYQKDQ